jgi:hypothetical protein
MIFHRFLEAWQHITRRVNLNQTGALIVYAEISADDTYGMAAGRLSRIPPALIPFDSPANSHSIPRGFIVN